MVSLGEWLVTGVFILLAFIRLVIIVCYFVFVLGITSLTAIKVIAWLVIKMKPYFGSRVVEKEQNVTSIS